MGKQDRGFGVGGYPLISLEVIREAEYVFKILAWR